MKSYLVNIWDDEEPIKLYAEDESHLLKQITEIQIEFDLPYTDCSYEEAAQ